MLSRQAVARVRPGCLSSQAGTLGKRDLAGWLEASAGPGPWKEDSERPFCPPGSGLLFSRPEPPVSLERASSTQGLLLTRHVTSGEPPPPPLWGRLGGACAPAPRWGRVPLVAYCDPRLPLQVGGGSRWAPPGVWQVGGTGAWVRCVCTRSAPHGVVSLGAEGGRCWGCNVQLALASPTLQPWCGRAYRACPFPTSHSWWRRVVTVRAASLECDPQDVEPQGGSLG